MKKTIFLEKTSEIEQLSVTVAKQEANLIRPTNALVGNELAEKIIETFFPLVLTDENINLIFSYIDNRIIPAEKFRLPMTGRTYTKKPPVFVYGKDGNREYFFFYRTSGSHGRHAGLHEVKALKYKPSLYPYVRDGAIIIVGKKATKT